MLQLKAMDTRCAAAFLAVCVVYLINIYAFQCIYSIHGSLKSDFNGVVKQLKLCMQQETLFDKLVDVTEKCIKQMTNISSENLLELSVGHNGEKKVFLKPLDFGENQCYELTIGIGKNSEAEMKLLKHYPMCKIFGIEADPQATGNFRKYGTLILQPVGVITENRSIAQFNYSRIIFVRVMRETKSLTDLLDTHLKTRFVHFVTMDLEGLEFELLKAFFYGGKFDKDNIIFCQIDVELHNNMLLHFQEDEFLKDLLKYSPYVIIHAAKWAGRFKVVNFTLINIINAECEKQFNFRAYFGA